MNRYDAWQERKIITIDDEEYYALPRWLTACSQCHFFQSIKCGTVSCIALGLLIFIKK